MGENYAYFYSTSFAYDLSDVRIGDASIHIFFGVVEYLYS
jgi:hypothetical protein